MTPGDEMGDLRLHASPASPAKFTERTDLTLDDARQDLPRQRGAVMRKLVVCCGLILKYCTSRITSIGSTMIWPRVSRFEPPFKCSTIGPGEQVGVIQPYGKCLELT